ncbi:VOC family protein [Natronolimnobius baerhuensis]|uniref:Lactoylglutathione lyase n=1 Tax=Natronolimnobius baerhuensis TaxID=253108 RepID=A0A202EAF0_9EURY|nr:VOC family protein [Natronolimnobius baerhuensis]OVE85209.1 lactoylglutathione lyase [Natronolimnobius baerhuensis]
MELSSVYVTVEDMDRALEFYRELFDSEPVQEEERFSMFEFDGTDFGLYNPAYDGEDAEYGTNCVPNFEVDDVDAAYERTEALAQNVGHDILEVGDYRMFQFVDSEGNTIEVFSVDD